MNSELYDRIRRQEGSNGSGYAERQGPAKQSAVGVRLPPMAIEKRAYTGHMSLPEIRPTGQDRRSRREAEEAQRQVGYMVNQALQARVAIEAVRNVSTYMVYSIDQAQEDMTDLLYAKERHEGMNELLAQVIAQSIQQLVAQTMALAELHYKRQTEAL